MKYKSFAISLLGAKHSAEDMPCQDASGTFEINDIQMAAVADGHGSRDCFRSQIGSSVAVQTFFELASISLLNRGETFTESGLKKYKYDLMSKWREKVKKDWDERLQITEKLGDGEKRFSMVTDKYLNRYLSEDPEVVGKYLYTAYGTTLLGLISIGTQVLLLQIGDGTCIVLQKDGLFTTPVPEDEDNFINVTTSLCDDNADMKMRYAILDCDPNYPTAPVAIFMSSDGLDDCYSIKDNKEHLFKLYNNILNNIVVEGYEATNKELVSEVLPMHSEKGSRDDISLGYLVVDDIDVLRKSLSLVSLPQRFGEQSYSDTSSEKNPEETHSDECDIGKDENNKETE